MKPDLTKEDYKKLTASLLLDVVAAAVPGPVSVVLPSIGNVLLSAKDAEEMNKIKRKIAELEEQQEKQEEVEEIKNNLEKLYETVKTLNNNNKDKEIYSIDVICASFICPIEDQTVISELTDSLYKFLDGELVYINQYDGTEIPINNWTEEGFDDVGVDTLFVNNEEIVFNLIDSTYRSELNDFLAKVDEIIKREDNTHYENGIKYLSYY